jgi:hypothetical protein
LPDTKLTYSVDFLSERIKEIFLERMEGIESVMEEQIDKAFAADTRVTVWPAPFEKF